MIRGVGLGRATYHLYVIMRRGHWPAFVLATGALTVAMSSCGAETDGGAEASASGGVDSTIAMPPWPAPADDVPALVERAGLELGPMGTAEHYHPVVRIIIDGEQVSVPPNIGVDPGTGAMSAVHTHEGDGTIHVEADTVGEVFTLGQLFTQWNVSLGKDHIGGVKGENPVGVTVTTVQ